MATLQETNRERFVFWLYRETSHPSESKGLLARVCHGTGEHRAAFCSGALHRPPSTISGFGRKSDFRIRSYGQTEGGGKTAERRKNVKVNSRLYEVERQRLKDHLSSLQTNKVTVVDKNGSRFRVSKDDPRIASLELVKFYSATKGTQYTDGQTTIYIKRGEPVPNGFYHHNTGKASYIVNGQHMRLRTDDPLVLSGEAVAVSKGRRVSEENRRRSRELTSGTKLVRMVPSGEIRRFTRDEIASLPVGSWEDLVKKGHKKSRTEAYVEAAKHRARLCCIQCWREVPVNIFGRYHGEKCKWQK